MKLLGKFGNRRGRSKYPSPRNRQIAPIRTLIRLMRGAGRARIDDRCDSTGVARIGPRHNPIQLHWIEDAAADKGPHLLPRDILDEATENAVSRVRIAQAVP